MNIEYFFDSGFYIIKYKDLLCFQAKQTTVCCLKNKKVYLNKDYWNNQKRKVNKYLYIFLTMYSQFKIEQKKDLDKLIKNNEITILSLNEMKKELL